MTLTNFSPGNLSTVVLTIGEQTLQRAIDSLNKQSLKPSEIIIVNNVSPFHAALNHGASQVKTDFFLQLDSDMVLDKDCIFNLMMNMQDGVGIVLGQLRDPLMGAETGVKIFRTSCFEYTKFKNSISPDTDFYNDLLFKSWKIRRALYLSREENYGKYWYTFGDHLPDYTPLYVYRRYYLLGQRYRYRRDLNTFLWRLQELRRVNHKYSVIAQVSICHGIFFCEERDQLNKNLYTETPDYQQLHNFLYGKLEKSRTKNGLINRYINSPAKMFSHYYKTGIEIRKNNELESFFYYMNSFSDLPESDSWIAKTAICHGLLSDGSDSQNISNKFNLLMQITK